MKIYVKIDGGKTITLLVEPSDTIKDLKTKFQDKEGIPPNRQSLTFLGKKLENNQLISDYGIVDNSTVSITYIQWGGGYSYHHFLQANMMSPLLYQQRSNSTPSHRQHHDGVSSEGICVNPRCRVYGQHFLCRHGYGLYVMYKDATVCPECLTQSPRVESFGFSRASVKIRAMEVGVKGQKPVVRENLSENVGGFCHLSRFDPNFFKNVDYEFIEVYSCVPKSTVDLELFEFCSHCHRVLQGICEHGVNAPG